MDITYSVTDFFFDQAAVIEKVGKARNRALLVSGAYIRRKGRDLLRRGKKPAKPGQPPKVHSGEPNLKTILFFLDPATDSMVVGSVKLNTSRRLKSNRSTAAELMEKGGASEITELSPDGGKTWIDRSEATKAAYRGKRMRSRKRMATFTAHPYMRIALEQALPSIPEKFRDLI